MRSQGARSDTLAHTCVELASPFGPIAFLVNSLHRPSIGDAWLDPELAHRSGIRLGKRGMVTKGCKSIGFYITLSRKFNVIVQKYKV